MKETTNQRKTEFDIAKAMAMYLVIVGHVIQYIISGDFPNNPIWQFIYVFHVPLFFIISGYFLKLNILKEAGGVAMVFKRLVYPSIVIGFIAAIFLSMMTIAFGRPLIDYNKFYSLIVVDCWYLKSQFAVFFIIFCCGFIHNKWIRIIALYFVFHIHAFYIKDLWYVSYSMPFILFGIFLHTVYDRLISNKYYMYVIFLVVSLLSIFWHPDYLYYFSPYNLSITSICHNAFRIIYAIFVSLLILLLLKRIIDIIPTQILSAISSVGRNTLFIYLLQFLLIERILCYANFSTGSSIVDNALIVPLLSIVLIYLFHKIALYIRNNTLVLKILNFQR